MVPLEFPLKHALCLPWRFHGSSDLEEVTRRLEGERFYVLRPAEHVLVATSRSRPAAVIFVIFQRDARGGELVLVQTHLGWYRAEQFPGFLRIFGKLAGIKVELKGRS